MTTFGFDLSHYQAGMHGDFASAKRQGYQFAMLKCTEGTTYADSSYSTFLADAKANGYLTSAYHFLHNGNGAAQGAWFAAHIADKSLGVMIDLEANGAGMDDARAFRAAVKANGCTGGVTLYLPHWYWQKIGSPSLKGWKVVASAYPSTAHTYGSVLYGGDTHADWNSYGGVRPVIWQFASSGRINGHTGNVDLDAYRGTRAELAATGLFKDYGKPTDTEPAKVIHKAGPPKSKPAPKHHPAKTPAPAPEPVPVVAPHPTPIVDEAVAVAEKGVAANHGNQRRKFVRLRAFIKKTFGK